MSLQFNPQSPIVAAASSAPDSAAKPLSVLMMAPLSLTPLVPPSTGPALRAPVATPERSAAAERRQALFAEKQKALMERLASDSPSHPAAQQSALSPAQRDACLAVLKSLAAAVAAAD